MSEVATVKSKMGDVENTDQANKRGRKPKGSRLSVMDRAREEGEAIIKSMGGDVMEVEGRRRTRSSVKGTPVATPPPAKKEKKSPATPGKAKGRGRPKKNKDAEVTDETDSQDENKDSDAKDEKMDTDTTSTSNKTAAENKKGDSKTADATDEDDSKENASKTTNSTESSEVIKSNNNTDNTNNSTENKATADADEKSTAKSGATDGDSDVSDDAENKNIENGENESSGSHVEKEKVDEQSSSETKQVNDVCSIKATSTPTPTDCSKSSEVTDNMTTE